MSTPGARALFDVGMSYMAEHWPRISERDKKTIEATLTKIVDGQVDFDSSSAIITRILNDPQPMLRVKTIVQMQEQPIPLAPCNRGSAYLMAQRHRARPWTAYEDQRLISAIYKYGFDSWISVAAFVGNGRTRSQCSQRWNRCLNPKISKGTWSKDDEGKLIRLAKEYGRKSWAKVAQHFGNRSDVQCRYRYRQLLKEGEGAAKEGAGGLGVVTTSDDDFWQEDERKNDDEKGGGAEKEGESGQWKPPSFDPGVF